MEKENKKFLDKVKDWAKVGVMSVGIAAFGVGDKTVDAHQVPETNSHRQVETVQNQREAFNKSIRVELKGKTEKVEKVDGKSQNRENMREKKGSEQRPLPNIPFASNEEKAQMRDLNYTLGLLHKKRTCSKCNQKDIKIRKIHIRFKETLCFTKKTWLPIG